MQSTPELLRCTATAAVAAATAALASVHCQLGTATLLHAPSYTGTVRYPSLYAQQLVT
jgi:hypothetical protein